MSASVYRQIISITGALATLELEHKLLWAGLEMSLKCTSCGSCATPALAFTGARTQAFRLCVRSLCIVWNASFSTLSPSKSLFVALPHSICSHKPERHVCMDCTCTLSFALYHVWLDTKRSLGMLSRHPDKQSLSVCLSMTGRSLLCTRRHGLKCCKCLAMAGCV